MSEEPPGNWELQRSLNKLSTDLRDGLAQLNTRLDSMVTTGVHEAQLGRVDDRLKELSDDIAQEREARKTGERAVQEQLQRMITTQRWVAAMIVLPIALFVANIVLNAWGGTTP